MKQTIITMVAFISVCLIYGYYSTQNEKLENELSLQTTLVQILEEDLAQKRETTSTRLSLNYTWPIHLDDWIEGELSSPFGERPLTEAGGLSDGFHEGLDLWGVSHVGTWKARVCAIADGYVLDHWIDHPTYGRYIVIQHYDGNKSEYGHLSASYIHEKHRDGSRWEITKGYVLGRQGDSGMSNGIHLHFGLKINDKYVNPLEYIELPNEKPIATLPERNQLPSPIPLW